MTRHIDDILCRPQDYIGVGDAQNQPELNFGDIIIGAPLGTPVLCPVDGKINEIFSNLVADSIPNLILDLRFNHGGPEASVEGVYAHLAQKPFCTSLRKTVNKKNGYACFGSCPVDNDENSPFADYKSL